MSTEAKLVINTDERRRVLTKALDLQIQRRIRRARQLREDARHWSGGRAAALRGVADEEDRLRRRAEQLKEEINGTA